MAKPKAAPVRTSILRSYYEAMFRCDNLARFKGATFDEYFALVQRRYPGVSPYWAANEASNSGRPDFRARIADFEPDPPFVDTQGIHALAKRYRTLWLDERQTVDLARALKSKDIRVIDLARSDVVSWQALAGGDFVSVELRISRTEELARIEPPARAEMLRLGQSDNGCATVLGFGMQARKLGIVHRTPVSLGLFARQDALEELVVSAPFVFGARHLGTRSLRKLVLSSVDFTDELRGLVAANAASLEELSLRSYRPFRPGDLPKLPKLRLLSVPAYAEYKDEWIAFAMRFERGLVDFQLLGGDDDRYSYVEPVGDADLVCVKDPKKETRRFELWTVLGPPVSADLDKRLVARAKALKLPVRWSLSGGLLVATASAPDPCREAARLVGEIASNGAAPAAGTARPRQKAKVRAEWLDPWEEEIPPALVAKARAILTEGKKQLRKAGARATPTMARTILKRAVEQLNRLHAKNRNFIGTLEAEELHDALGTLVAETKLEDVDELIEEWRDW